MWKEQTGFSQLNICLHCADKLYETLNLDINMEYEDIKKSFADLFDEGIETVNEGASETVKTVKHSFQNSGNRTYDCLLL